MNRDETMMRIADLENEIDSLPEGSLTKKNIKGRDYYYHRITENGKRKEMYVSFEDVSYLQVQIERRKKLAKELKELKAEIYKKEGKKKKSELKFRTRVRTGSELKLQIQHAKDFKKRECIASLRDYIHGDSHGRVFILYGLRRTGKTTMIRQIILELSDMDFKKAAFIQIMKKDTIDDIDEDLRLLEKNGYKYIFIDEVTLLEDFIENAALFSDIYAGSGMKIVLSGTDSLGFAFSKEEQLYDRCYLLHTTFIPYREFEYVLGIKGIDEYIRYGGTMSKGGADYNYESVFSSAETANEYIDTAIARNIQHSLKNYEYGGHFRLLYDLYEKSELTNVINRVVENINHNFALSVIESTFKSHDISVTSSNLLRDRNKEEQRIDVSDAHLVQIKEYLELLDLVNVIDIEYLPVGDSNGSMTVIAQPGMRYAQAKAIVSNLLLDAQFNELSSVERRYILDRLLSEIRGRMMEEIILLETKIAKPDKKVFKLQFITGEFDMVIYDPEELTCEIFEIKYSKERVPEQYRHIINEEKCAMTIHRYGEITGRYVIYRGEKSTVDDVIYLNAEEYLKGLYDISE